MKTIQQLLSAALFVVVAANARSQSSEPEKPAAGDTILATVDGEPIRRSEVDQMINPQLESQLAQLPEARAAEVRGKAVVGALNETIARKIMLKVAAREGLEPTAGEMKENMAAMVAQAMPNASVEQFLKSSGVPRERFESDVRERIVIAKLIEAKTRDVPSPTEEAIQQLYKAEPDRFFRQVSVRARHILFATSGISDPAVIAEKQARADRVLKQLQENKDTDFAALALAVSEGPLATKGGNLGEFGYGDLVPEMEEAAFALKPGEISGVVESPFGFHIIKVEERNEPRLLPLEEVREELAAGMHKQAKMGRLHELIEEWKAQSNVQFVGVPKPVYVKPGAAPAAVQPE